MAKSMEVAQTAKVLSTRSFAAWHALAKALFDDYRPELHYMRGPGPKWREKYHWAGDWRPVFGRDESLDGGSSAVSAVSARKIGPETPTRFTLRGEGPLSAS